MVIKTPKINYIFIYTIMKYKLYIKKCPSGLMYLGKFTERKKGLSIDKYLGSGIYWKNHLKSHNFKLCDIETYILYETEIYEDFVKNAIFWSNILDVVKNENFANLTIEEGKGGGLGSPLFIKDDPNHPSKKIENKIKQSNRSKGSNNPMYGKGYLVSGINNPMFGSKRPEVAEKNKKLKSKPVQSINKKTGIITNFESTRDASRKCGIDQSNISFCCKNNNRTAGGFFWKFINL